MADLSLSPARHLGEFFTIPRSATLAGVAYFFVDDGIHGNELWRSDGTALGTYLLKDTCPGRCGLDVTSLAWSGLAVAAGKVFFAADDGVHGAELWVTNGTALGTRLVRDIYPGLQSSQPSFFFESSGLLLFSADDGIHGTELWRSDGTPAGTFLLAELTPGASGGSIEHLYQGPGFLYAAGGGFATGPGLWRVDGTPGGTYPLVDQKFLGSWLSKWLTFATLPDGRLVFGARDVEHGDEPWISDGTLPGTHLLSDLVPGTESSNPDGFASFGSAVLFYASSLAVWGGLFSVEGSEPTVTQISLPDGVSPTYNANYTVLGDAFLFAASDADSGRELWKLTGTDASRIVDLWPGPDSGVPWLGFGYFDTAIQTLGTTAIFAGMDGTNGLELWSTDGSPGGTARLSDLAPGDEPTFLPFYQAAEKPDFRCDPSQLG